MVAFIRVACSIYRRYQIPADVRKDSLPGFGYQFGGAANRSRQDAHDPQADAVQEAAIRRIRDRILQRMVGDTADATCNHVLATMLLLWISYKIIKQKGASRR